MLLYLIFTDINSHSLVWSAVLIFVAELSTGIFSVGTACCVEPPSCDEVEFGNSPWRNEWLKLETGEEGFENDFEPSLERLLSQKVCNMSFQFKVYSFTGSINHGILLPHCVLPPTCTRPILYMHAHMYIHSYCRCMSPIVLNWWGTVTVAIFTM